MMRFIKERIECQMLRPDPLVFSKRPIDELIGVVAERLGLKPKLICSGNRQRQYSDARSLVAWLAVEEIGHPAAEVARFLGISRVGVKKAVGRGMQLKTHGLLNE